MVLRELQLRNRSGWNDEQSEDLVQKRIRGGFCSKDRGCPFQVWPGLAIRQFQRKRLSARGGTVFGGQHQLAMMAAQVEERIDPRIQIRGAAETVTGAA